MIVGNGEVAADAAPFIDACDMVIRFNGCRNFGLAGRRTDIVALCNTGRPAKAMLEDETWRASEAVKAASALWMVRDPAHFEALRTGILARHPELDDFFDDYTAAFAGLCASQGKQHVVIPGAIHGEAVAQLRLHDGDPGVVPSSGMIVITHLLNDPAYRQDKIMLTGFSHEGWEGHPFAAEKRLIDALVAAGRVSRLGSTHSSSSHSSTLHGDV
ncbi:Urease operon accessory protein [Allorhizobium undicola]|uniref:Urease operon accessory protein n=1 Tax=Allorhizobium undicola TaxID=78527 RepID=UPI003D35072F